MTEFVVVLITASKEDEAAAIAKELVDSGLAACVNIIADIRSIYRWQGKTEDAREALLVVKSRRDLLSDLVVRVKELHSYRVPEVIALPILDGSGDYLDWLRQETRP